MSDLYYDPFDADIDDDPFDLYRRLRDEAPVYFNEKYDFYAISRHDDIKAALVDWQHFSNVDALALEQPPMPPSIITMDPPAHDIQRKLVSRTFTPRRVAGLEDFLRRMVNQYLDDLPLDGTGDFVEDFSPKPPVAVICELLGVPAADREQWRLWTQGMADMFEVGEDGMPEIKPNVFESALALAAYLEEMVKERVERPADDLVGALVQARQEGGDEVITNEELVGLIAILLLAGNDTTNILLGNMMHALTKFPDQRRRLFGDPSLIPAAVEETMRYDNSIHALVRTVPATASFLGHEIDPSKKLVLLLGSGNRDERKYDDPDVFDLDRESDGHLGFGHGIHFCVGAALARLETRVVLEELLGRVADIDLDLANSERVRISNFHGFRRLPFSATLR
jgi:hypothetical protein